MKNSLTYINVRNCNNYLTISMDNNPTLQEKTQKFFKTVEAGDIALFDIFEEAIAMFGFTKVGKTSSCHILCGSPLRSQDQRGQLIYRSTTQRYANAKIGATTESQTQIPNIFQAQVKERGVTPAKFKKVWLLDQPGYGDTYGFHRIFSNGYFHYRTFSKTPKLKFVLAVNKNDITGTAEYFKKTIFNFINSFANWESVRGGVLKATSLLITKADLNTRQQNINSIITNLRESVTNMGKSQKQNYQGVIDELLKSERIFFIQKPRGTNQNTLDSPILQKIYDLSTFWDRTKRGNVVEMKQINFSVSDQILKDIRDKNNELFREEFEHFMKFLEKRMNGMIISHEGSLVNIVRALQKDAVNSNESKQFLQHMQSFLKEYYSFFQQYKDKRQNTEVNLFKSPQNERWAQVNNEELQKEMRNIYFIKKFKVLQFLQTINRDVEDNMVVMTRSIEELEEFSSMFIAIFKRLSILRVNPRDKTIFKYSYVIQRAIEESKILALILFTNDHVKQQIARYDVWTFSEDIFRTLKDKFFTGEVGQINVNALKEDFIAKIDFDQLTSVNQEIICFFESIPAMSEQIKIKIAELIAEYSSIIFKNDRTPTDAEKKFAVLKLFKYRNDFFAYLKSLEKQQGGKQSKEKVVELIIRNTNCIAFILQTYRMYEDARQCYRSVNNAEMVFQMYELECDSLTTDKQQHRKLLLEFGEQAHRFYRKQLAMKCCQKAYSLSTRYAEIKQVSRLIEKLCTEKECQDGEGMESEEELSYLKRLVRGQYCSDFSENLRSNIEILIDL